MGCLRERYWGPELRLAGHRHVLRSLLNLCCISTLAWDQNTIGYVLLGATVEVWFSIVQEIVQLLMGRGRSLGISHAWILI